MFYRYRNHHYKSKILRDAADDLRIYYYAQSYGLDSATKRLGFNRKRYYRILKDLKILNARAMRIKYVLKKHTWKLDEHQVLLDYFSGKTKLPKITNKQVKHYTSRTRTAVLEHTRKHPNEGRKKMASRIGITEHYVGKIWKKHGLTTKEKRIVFSQS